MFCPQYWTNRVPTSSFEQTQYEADQMFYATFPAARDAAYNAILEQNLYEPPRSTDCSTLHEGAPLLKYDIGNEQKPDISGTSVPLNGPSQEPSYPPLHFDYAREVHPQQPSPLSHQHHPSYYPPPIENESPVYIPFNQRYNSQYSSEPTPSYILQSPLTPGPVQESNFLVNQPSDARRSPLVKTEIHESISDGRSPESPRYGFRQLNRHMKPPTLKFTNNCQLAVMRLDRLAEQSQLDPPKRNDQPYTSSSNISQVTPSPTVPTPTEFLLNSAKSPSIGLSSLPSKNLPERKPPLACLFCRGRKIACGPPLPGSAKKTCNQCRKRSLQCHYPSESRRGMRKKKPANNSTTNAEATTKITSKIKSQK